MLAAAIACAAAAPLLQPIAPSWAVHVSRLQPIPGIAPSKPDTAQAARFPVTSAPAREAGVPTQTMVDVGAVLGWIWIAGVAFNGLLLIAGLGRLFRRAARADRSVPVKWVNLAQEIALGSGLGRPLQLLLSDHPSLPVTWGCIRPKILLPSSANDWTEDRMRVVLLHEIAHIRRGDWITQMAAECLKAAYWFNPLVWVASKRLRQESEHACDDAVLNDGVDGEEYASHLLALARSMTLEGRRPFSEFPAPAMARPSSLERRFTAMLNNRVNRSPLTRSTRAATTIGALAITLLVAGFGAAQTFVSFSGTALDPTNRLLPGVTVFLTNVQSQAKYQVQTDGTGRFEFVGLPPGEYAWETELAGFASLKGSLTVSGRDVQQDLTLQVGSLEETITVRGTAPSASTDTSSPAETQIAKIRQLAVATQRMRQIDLCPGPAGGIGGAIKAPRQLAKVNPRYPDHLVATGIAGVVELNATIGTDGDVRELTVERAPHPDLAAAAVDAVRQWQYSATLLNCQPIEVHMSVHVLFMPE